MLRLFFCLLVVSLPSVALADSPPDWRVNAEIGDVSWLSTHDRAPSAGTDDVARIRTHLYWVADRLETAAPPLAPGQRENRRLAVGWLRDYAAAGNFPQRRPNDGYAGRRPRFIDDRGVHCAVGELIRLSGRGDLASAIDDRWEFSYVPDIDSAELLDWAERFGFTVDELAMIQPAYGPPPSAETTEAEIMRSKDGITLRCATDHVPDPAVRLRTQGDRKGRVGIRLAGPDTGFARCFFQQLASRSIGGGAWDQQPKAFKNRIKVPITPPSEILQTRLDRVVQLWQSTVCSPRPGNLVRSADARVEIGREGVGVTVETSPQNDEVAACLEDDITRQFADIEGGRWRIELRGSGSIGTTVSQRPMAQNLEHQAAAAGRACYGKGPVRELSVRVIAAPVATDFHITVAEGSPEFQACVVDHLSKVLRSTFSVSRKMPSGDFERFFRIDGFVDANATVEIESPEAHEKRMKDEMERMERERQPQL